MEWLLFLSQLPTNPSSLRVTVWRRMRSVGALGVQNGVWMLPDRPEPAAFLQELAGMVLDQGGGSQILKVMALNEQFEAEILARFRAERAEEYAEFLERSAEFLAEIDKEIGNLKFTFAELEENEQDLQRLTGWLEKIQKRDFLGGDKAQEAASMLSRCCDVLKDFTDQVYKKQTQDGDTADL